MSNYTVLLSFSQIGGKVSFNITQI